MKQLLLVLFVPMFFAQVAYAGQTIQLNLDQAVERALKAHEAINISKAEKDIAQAKLFSARSGMLPSVSADYARVKYKMSGALTPTEKMMPEGHTESLDVTVTQPLFTFGKIYRGTQMAKKGVEIGDLGIQDARQQIAFGAKALYYKVLFSKRKLEISRESYMNAQRNQRQLLERQRFGRSSRADQIKMEADIAMRVPALKLAETEYNNNLQSLKEHLRIPREDNLVLSQGFDELKVSSVPRINMTEAEAKRPQLEQIKKGIEVSDLQIANARASFAPDFAAFVQYNPTRIDKDIDMGDSEWKTATNIGVGISFSFGGSKIGSLKEAVNSKYKNAYAYQVMKSSYENQLSNLISTYESLIEVYGAAKHSYKLAIDTYKLTESMFKAGNISQTYLNDRELQLTQAKLGVAESLMNIHTVYAQIVQLASLETKNE